MASEEEAMLIPRTRARVENWEIIGYPGPSRPCRFILSVLFNLFEIRCEATAKPKNT